MGCHWRILVYIFICLFPPSLSFFSLSWPPFSLCFYFTSFFSSLSTYMVWLWRCALSFIYKSPSVTLSVGYIIPGCFFFFWYRRSINSVARGKDEGGWWFGCKWQRHHHYGVIPHEMAGIITAKALWLELSGWANAERYFIWESVYMSFILLFRAIIEACLLWWLVSGGDPYTSWIWQGLVVFYYNWH